MIAEAKLKNVKFMIEGSLENRRKRAGVVIYACVSVSEFERKGR